MRTLYRHSLSLAAAGWLALAAPGLRAQTSADAVVTGAPYSADVVTTVKLTTFGTPIEMRVIARMYRDSAGRIRREQAVGGLDAPGADNRSDLVVTIVDPVAGVLYALNPATRTALRMPIDRQTTAAAGTALPELPASPNQIEEPLGAKDIDGLRVVGRRTAVTLPDPSGNNRPVLISDERWESADLKLVLLALHHDPRSGEFEHRLSNISRAEPARSLFAIPADYTILDPPLVPAGR